MHIHTQVYSVCVYVYVYVYVYITNRDMRIVDFYI